MRWKANREDLCWFIEKQYSRETILWFFFLTWQVTNGQVQWTSQMIKDPNSGTIEADWVVVEIRPRLTNTSNERRDRLWAMSDKKGETLEHYPRIWSGSLNNKPTARIQMSRVIPGKQACPPWWVGWWKEYFPWNTSRLISLELMTFWAICVQVHSKVRLPNNGRGITNWIELFAAIDSEEWEQQMIRVNKGQKVKWY